LLDCLGELVQGRTTFIIAHRLTTVSLADEIILLDEGRLVAMGRHADLLARDELYQKIHETYRQMNTATGANREGRHPTKPQPAIIS